MKNYFNEERGVFRLRGFSFSILLLLSVLVFPLRAQIVLTTATGTGYDGGNGVGGDAAVTFVIENTSSNAYIFNELDMFWQTANSNSNIELWVSSTDLSGLPNIAAPAWSQIATGGPVIVPTNGYYPTLNNIAYIIPANSVLRFAVRSSNGIRYSGPAGPPAPSSFTMSGVSLHSGDFQINGQNIGYGGAFPSPTNQPRWFTGGVTLISATGTDLAISEFIQPLAACPGSSDVVVAIQNVGGDSITSATLGWTVNGVAQTPVTWTGQLNTGDTTHVTLGAFATAANTVYNIETFISSVGPGSDNNTSNDTLGLAYQAAIDGNFTINPSAPASATNFQSFTDAVNALNTFGVCGPVVFEAVADTFSEQVELGAVVGASAVNTITFKGAGAGNTVLTFEQNVTSERFTFRLEGSSFVTLDSMSIVAPETGSFGWPIHLFNGAQDITVKNCSIVTHASTTSTNYNGIVASGSNTSYTTGSAGFSNLVFDNNVFVGGYNSVRLNGLAASRVENVQFTNNELVDLRWAGFYVTQGNNLTVDNNFLIGQNGITTGGGIYLLNIDGFTITNNRVFDQGQYSLYFSNCSGTSANPALIANNELSGIGNTGNFGSAIRFLGSSSNVDIVNNSALQESGTGRVFQITVATPSNLRLLNNTFVHTESNGYAMFISNANVLSEINNNNYFSPGANFVHYNSDVANLAALQAVNNPAGNDANSVSADPLYVASNNLIPLNGALDGAGVAFPTVTTDITGATRATPPDIGAYEFVPVNADLALVSGELLNGQCLSSNDSISFRIVNTVGATINFAVDSVVVTYEVTGPANTTGTVVFNSGILAEGDTATVFGGGIDLSIPGIYTLNAFIDVSVINESPANDTLAPVVHEVRPVITVTPQTITVNNPNDSVTISVTSPFMPGGDVFISEICHFRGSANGAPVGGWPSWLIADDFIEISGVPNTDISGYTIEMWSDVTLTNASVLAPGTILSPQGTAVIATGQLGSSVPSPANFYYHSGYTGTMGSTTAQGYIIKDQSGNIVDAVVYGNIAFPAAANVSAADWSGTTPAQASAGNRLEGPYTKDATNWINSSVSPQDPNVVNNNVTLPAPPAFPGLEWSLQGNVIDTLARITVGPWPVPGTYYYVATYQSPCGPLTDSVEVIVDFPFCAEPDSVVVDASCTEAEVNWVSGPDAVSTAVEYGPVGFAQGTGTLVSNVSSPYLITGLTANLDYDVYIIDSCGSGQGLGVAMETFTTLDEPFAAGISVNDNGNGNFDFSADVNSVGTITWDFGDGNGASGDSVSHTYGAPGAYTVTMIAENACGADTITTTVDFISIDKFALTQIGIFPNPTSGAFVVDNLPQEGGQIIIRINDMQGRTIISRVLNQGQQQRLDLDLGHLSAGTYFLNISNDAGTITKPVLLKK
ncbi:MAG: T9SS C-terminal target domain-containing protein [Flavobacteriales bacterium]|nr:MAG: T9SS C-terminal target domain-containing protein [Flavobacteriales bacterium]